MGFHFWFTERNEEVSNKSLKSLGTWGRSKEMLVEYLEDLERRIMELEGVGVVRSEADQAVVRALKFIRETKEADPEDFELLWKEVAEFLEIDCGYNTAIINKARKILRRGESGYYEFKGGGAGNPIRVDIDEGTVE